MSPRDRTMLLLVIGVIAAGALTVALGTMISTMGGFQAEQLALVMPVLMVAVLAVWALSRGRR